MIAKMGLTMTWKTLRYHVENTEIDNLGYEEEHTVVSSSTSQHKSSEYFIHSIE